MHLGVCRRIVLFVGKQEFQVVGMMMAVGTGTVIDRAGRDDGHNTAGNMEYCWEKKRRVPGYVIRLGKQKKEKRKEVALLGVDTGQARQAKFMPPLSFVEGGG